MVKYELEKVCCHKVTLFFLTLCIFINLFFMYQQNKNSFWLTSQDFTDVGHTVSKMDSDEGQQWCTEEINHIWEESDISKLNVERMNVLTEWQQRLAYKEQYIPYLEQVQAQAENMKHVSIFGNPEDFSYKNVVKTGEDFANLFDLTLDVDYPVMVELGTKNNITDFLVIFLMFLFAWQIFLREREQGLIPLLRSTEKGKQPLAICKIGTFFLLSIGVTILLQLTNLLVAGWIGGIGGNWNAPIQSIRQFRSCNLKLSIMEYVLCYFGIKMLGALAIGGIVCALFDFTKNVKTGLLLVLAVLGVEYILYITMDAMSPWNVFKFINVFALMDGRAWFDSYRNVNLAGNVVGARECAGILGIVLLGITSWLSVVCYCSRGSAIILFRGKLRNWLNKKGIHWIGHRSLFLHTGYQIYILGAVLLVTICVALYSSWDTPRPMADTNRSHYTQYIEVLAPMSEEEAQAYLQEESLWMTLQDEEALSRKKALDEGTITQEAYDKWYESRMLVVSGLQEDFSTILIQKDTIDHANQKFGKGAGWVDNTKIEGIFMDRRNQYILQLVAMIGLALAIPQVFGQEYRHQEIKLVHSCRRGRGYVFSVRLFQGFLYSSIIFATVYIPYCVYVWETIKPDGLDLLIQSLPSFENFTQPISFWTAWVGTMAIKYLSMLVTMAVMMAITILSRDITISMILGALAFVLPPFLQRMSIDVAAFTFVRFCYVSDLLTRNDGWAGFLMIVFGLIISGLLILAYSAFSYCTGQRVWKITAITGKRGVPHGA